MLLENTPTPTKNLNKARKDLDKYGFCLVPDALNAEEIKTAKKRLLEQAEAEENLGLSFRDGGEKQEVKFKEGKIGKNSFFEIQTKTFFCSSSLLFLNFLETKHFTFLCFDNPIIVMQSLPQHVKHSNQG